MPRQPYLSINFNTGSAQGGPTAAELTKRIRAQIVGNKWTSPGGGLILSIEIPQTVSLKKLSAALQIRNVRIMISNPAFMGSPHLHGFRVCPSSLKPETMRQRLEILGEALRKRL